MNEQIEPCPHCKMPATRGDKEVVDHATEYSPVGYHMRFFCCCVQCGMKGPIEDLPELADDNWNRIARAVREAQALREEIDRAHERISSQAALAGEFSLDAVNANNRAEKAEAERDALRELIERHNETMRMECAGCKSMGGQCDYCSLDYRINLPDAP